MTQEKINIAKLLENCPSGMELDCTVWKNLYFEEIINSEFPISCYFIQNGVKIHRYFTEYGHCYYNNDNDKCVIFPKGKTTWEGFVPSVKFKDGDIISNGKCICVYNGNENGKYYGLYVGVGHALSPNYFIEAPRDDYFKKEKAHIATKEEKQKLFQAIKNNGYKWNDKTKTLEKLIVPKFKVGDKIQYNGPFSYRPAHIIKSIEADRYILTDDNYIKFGYEDEYILLKFNVNTLKPFDQVLIRDRNEEHWHIQIFEKYNKNLPYPFQCMRSSYRQCIPYKGNELLLDTKDDCDNFYKTWEE
jgi:hypothetical protein